MKNLITFLFLVLMTSNVFAIGRSLKCDLFEDGKLLRSATSGLDAIGKGIVDLGVQDEFRFKGLAWGGQAFTEIASAEKSRDAEASDSVTSSTGTTLMIQCRVE